MRKKIYFLLGKVPIIRPESGCQITELSIIQCLQIYYDVYYNNQLIDFEKTDYGLKKKIIERPNQIYDYYWIRNNDEILLKCPGLKIRCGAPYNSKAYKICDVILTYSDSWRINLLKYNFKPKPSDGLYPQGSIVLPKTVMTFYQSIDDRFYNRINDQQRINLRKNLTKEEKTDFLIAHFGRVSDTCYPENLFKAFEKICCQNLNLNIKLIFCGKKSHYRRPILTNNPHVIINSNGVDYNQIHQYIQSVDLITSDYRSPTADWGGCMHIVEAMASGIPILCGNYDVRIEQLGSDYPFFWNKDKTDDEIQKQIYDHLIRLLSGQIDLAKLSQNLIQRSEKFRRQKVSHDIHLQLESYFGSI